MLLFFINAGSSIHSIAARYRRCSNRNLEGPGSWYKLWMEPSSIWMSPEVRVSQAWLHMLHVSARTKKHWNTSAFAPRKKWPPKTSTAGILQLPQELQCNLPFPGHGTSVDARTECEDRSRHWRWRNLRQEINGKCPPNGYGNWWKENWGKQRKGISKMEEAL